MQAFYSIFSSFIVYIRAFNEIIHPFVEKTSIFQKWDVLKYTIVRYVFAMSSLCVRSA
jgi:hypothetical protein